MAKMQTKLTFAITFTAPTGMTIPGARDWIKDALMKQAPLGITDEADVKVHLTNKETSYAKR